MRNSHYKLFNLKYTYLLVKKAKKKVATFVATFFCNID